MPISCLQRELHGRPHSSQPPTVLQACPCEGCQHRDVDAQECPPQALFHASHSASVLCWLWAPAPRSTTPVTSGVLWDWCFLPRFTQLFGHHLVHERLQTEQNNMPLLYIATGLTPPRQWRGHQSRNPRQSLSCPLWACGLTSAGSVGVNAVPGPNSALPPRSLGPALTWCSMAPRVTWGRQHCTRVAWSRGVDEAASRLSKHLRGHRPVRTDSRAVLRSPHVCKRNRLPCPEGDGRRHLPWRPPTLPALGAVRTALPSGASKTLSSRGCDRTK